MKWKIYKRIESQHGRTDGAQWQNYIVQTETRKFYLAYNGTENRFADHPDRRAVEKYQDCDRVLESIKYDANLHSKEGLPERKWIEGVF
ncbi:hypothetical protein P3T73_09845 [Kiritimatiellota bacterium B12222]|nr:hypothetical protein P3T73_09845 [Kiritimatiellota bacterium B12222]